MRVMMTLRFLQYCLMLFLTIFLLSCQWLTKNQSEKPKNMLLYVTVDWEGRSLDEEDIVEMQNFRQKFPHIPMLQLLNAAYFVRGHEYPERLTQIIKSTFLPADTQGLHVHAWKSLTQHCGVQYQHSPSFSDDDENCQEGDCGYTVSLEFAYTQKSLTKLLACSSEVLVKNGFNQPDHFRAGGWQLGPKLTAALAANGFIWDSSKIDADLLATRWHKDSGIVKMLRQLHPNSTPVDQPYLMLSTLMEYPNNAALADYTTTKQIVALFKGLIAANKQVMVLGFHQETAADFLMRLEKAIPQMEAIAKAHNIKLEWVSQ